MVVDPHAGDLHEIALLAEHQRVGRARFDAGRLLSFLEAAVAHRAFLDVRVPLVVLEFRNVVRAGDHAVSAPHALVGPPDDRAFLRLEHRVREAGGAARRLPAVETLLLHEDRALVGLVAIHHRPLLLGGGALLLERPVLLDIGNEHSVRLAAGHFTGAAPDAAGGVDKHADELGRRLGLCGRRLSTRESRADGAARLQKTPSIHDQLPALWQVLQTALASAPFPTSWQDQQFLWMTTLALNVSSAMFPLRSWWHVEQACGSSAGAPLAR